MKKFLLSIFLLVSLGYYNQGRAQCSGANVLITNFVLIPAGNLVNYSFTWQYVQGNASIEPVFRCNGVIVGTLPCIPRLKDSTAGPHTVSGSFNTTCVGTFRMELRIWTNPTCGGTNCIVFREIDRIPLPVSLKSFSAVRNRNAVTLRWETATEMNNSGFAVERNNGANWEQVAWIPSQAPGGNSDAVLAYSYTDINNQRGITQYRLKQVDADAAGKYSEIRSVRGEGQLGKTIVYPNPSNDGRVNIVFEDAAVTRDVTVTDISGRVIRQVKGIANNNITLDNLQPGMYTLRIAAPETGEVTLEKLVVNKR